MTSIRLPEALDSRLAALAQSTKRSKSYFIKEALIQYLEDMEDNHAVLQRLQQPNPVYYTHEEVKKILKERAKREKTKK